MLTRYAVVSLFQVVSLTYHLQSLSHSDNAVIYAFSLLVLKLIDVCLFIITFYSLIYSKYFTLSFLLDRAKGPGLISRPFELTTKPQIWSGLLNNAVI